MFNNSPGVDRAQRLADATDALASLPSVQWYHSILTDGNNQLTVDTNIAVVLPLALSQEAHLRLVPDLIQWTECSLNQNWRTLRQQLAESSRANGGGGPPVYTTLARHMKLNQVMDFVGQRAHESGTSSMEECHALIRRVHKKALQSALEVKVDDVTGFITDVQF